MEDYKKKYEEALENFKKIKAANKDNKELVNFIEYEYPELKESEDENIKNHMIKIFKSYQNPTWQINTDKWEGLEISKILTWLEKQGKESVVTDVLIKAGLKPYKDGNKWCILVGDNIQEGICGFGDTIDEALFEFLKELVENQGEQKSEEFPNGEDYGIDSLYHAARILEKTLGEVEGYQSDDGILEHKCAIEAVKHLYKQKPAWSEDDNELIDSVIELIDSGALDRDEKDYFIEKLESIKNRVLPKQEWSEEDEKILNSIIQDYEAASESFCGHKGKLDWLKSLKERVQPQPKQEWSEEDERLIEFLISHFSVCHPYRSFKFDINTDLTTDEIIERIRNLSSQSQWKPTDEQMEALYTYIYNPQYFNSPDPRMELVESVYKDLKKLREE